MSELSYLEKLLDGVKVEWKALADVVEFRRGSFPQPYGNSDWFDGEGSMPFVQVADVSDEGYRLNEETKQLISKLAQPKSVFVETGTVIVTLQGTLGRVAITQYDCYVDRTLAIFTNYKESINKKYFAYQLKSKFDVEKKNARGSTLKTITKQEFSKFQIAIPSLEVQNEIVRILDTFTTLTAELTAELITRKQQYSYYLEQLLTFNENEVERKALKEVVLPTSNIKWRDTDLSYRYIDLSSVSRENNSIIETSEITADNAPSRAQKSVLENDVIFATTRPTQQRLCLINSEYSGEVASTGYCVLRANTDKILPKWIFYYLSSIEFKNYVEEIQSGAAYPAISDTKVKEFAILIPPLPKQQRIVNILDKFNDLTTSLTEGLPREIELRQQQYEYYRELLLSFPKVEGNT